MRKRSDVGKNYFTFLRPEAGPMEGGTEITLHGRNITEGNNILVRFMLGTSLMKTVKATWKNETELTVISPEYDKKVIEAAITTNGNQLCTATLMVCLDSTTSVKYQEFPQSFTYYFSPVVTELYPFALPEHSKESCNDAPPVVEVVIAADWNSRYILENDDKTTTELLSQRFTAWVEILQYHDIHIRVSQYQTKSEDFISNQRASVLKVDDERQIVYLQFQPSINLLALGKYRVSVGLNSQQVGPVFVPNHRHSSSHDVHLLHVYSQPKLTEVLPKACYVNHEKPLRIKGKDFCQYSREDKSVVVKFTKDEFTLSVKGKLVGSVIECITKSFPSHGWYEVDISVNEGHTFTRRGIKLLVFLQLTCPYIYPCFGSSNGGMILTLKIMFLQKRLYRKDMVIPLEECEFGDAGCFKMRFLDTTTNQIWARTTAFVSKDGKSIQCITPRNSAINAFQYSQLESVGLQLSLDGVKFIDLDPEKHFSYFPAPRIASLSRSHGPNLGGTLFELNMDNQIPDTSICKIRFTSESGATEVVDGTIVGERKCIKCTSPKWDVENAGAKAYLEVSYNNMEFSNDGEKQDAVFSFFLQPEIQFIHPTACDTEGTQTLGIYGKHFHDHGQKIGVAFSDGVVTKKVSGHIVAGHIETTVPEFQAGVCQVCISFNNQQFTGKWNDSICISTNEETRLHFYDRPVFSAISPSCGPVAGGTNVVISGSNVLETNVISIKFTPIEAPENFIIVPASCKEGSVYCSTPVFPNSANVIVSCALNSRDFEGALQFEYYDRLTIRSIYPKRAIKYAATPLEISVVGLVVSSSILGRIVLPIDCKDESTSASDEAGGAKVYQRTHSFPVRQNEKNPSTITFCLPEAKCFPHSHLFVPYVACIIARKLYLELALDGQNYTRVSGNLLSPAAMTLYNSPVVTHVYPPCGSIKGSTKITIRGHNFYDTGEIFVRFYEAKSLAVTQEVVPATFIDETTLICFSPAWQERRACTSAPTWKMKLIDASNKVAGSKYHAVAMEVCTLSKQYVRIGSEVHLPRREARLKGLVWHNFTFVYYYGFQLEGEMNVSCGPASGGTICRLKGVGFLKSCKDYLTIRFGSFQFVPGSLVAPNEIEFVSPSLVPGNYSIQVSQNAQQYSGSLLEAPKKKTHSKFRNMILKSGKVTNSNTAPPSLNDTSEEEPAPLIFGVYDEPEFDAAKFIGTTDGGSSILIQGRGFIESRNTKVRFLPVDDSSSHHRDVVGIIKTKNAIQCTAPPSPTCGMWRIHVALNGQQFVDTTHCSFEYFQTPTLKSILPASWSIGGKSSVKSIEMNLSSEKCLPDKTISSCDVQFTDRLNRSNVIQVTGTVENCCIRCEAPQSDSATLFDIAFSFDGGDIYFNSNAFVVLYEPMGGIQSVSPACGPLRGGSEVLLKGRNWQASELDTVLVRLVDGETNEITYEQKGFLVKDGQNVAVSFKTMAVDLGKAKAFEFLVALNGVDFIGQDFMTSSLNPSKVKLNRFCYYRDPELSAVEPNFGEKDMNEIVRIKGDFQDLLRCKEDLNVKLAFTSSNSPTAFVPAEISERSISAKAPGGFSGPSDVQVLLNGFDRVCSTLLYTFYTPPFFVPNQKFSTFGGAYVELFMNASLSKVLSTYSQSLLRIRISNGNTCQYHYCAKIVEKRKIRFKTGPVSKPGSYNLEIVMKSETFSNGTKLQLFQPARITHCEPHCVAYQGSKAEEMTLLGKNFAENTLVRFLARTNDEKGTALLSWTERSTYRSNQEMICKMPSYSCIQAIEKEVKLPEKGIVLEVAASLNQGLEFHQSAAEVVLFNPSMMQHLDLKPQFTVHFAKKSKLNQFSISINQKDEGKYSFTESSKVYGLRFSTNNEQNDVVSCTRSSSTNLFCSTEIVNRIGATYAVNLTPNGIDYYPLGNVRCFNPVRLRPPVPSWIPYDVENPQSAKITLQVAQVEIFEYLPLASDLIMECELDATEAKNLVLLSCNAMYNKEDNTISFNLPRFKHTGEISLKLFTDAELHIPISTCICIHTFSKKHWVVKSVVPNCISLHKETDIRILGTGFEDTGSVLVNLKNANTSIDLVGNVDTFREFHILVESATELLAMDLHSSDPIVYLSHERTKHETSCKRKTLNPTWNEWFVFDVEDSTNVIQGRVYDKDFAQEDDFLGRFEILAKEFEDGKCHSKSYQLLSEDGKTVDRFRGWIKITAQWKKRDKTFTKNSKGGGAPKTFIKFTLPEQAIQNTFTVHVQPAREVVINTKLMLEVSDFPLGVKIYPDVLPWTRGGVLSVLSENWKESNSYFIRLLSLTGREGEKETILNSFPAEFVSAHEVQCTVPAYVNLSNEKSQKVKVSISMDKTTYLPTYRCPELRLFAVESVHPKCGPLCGGTQLSIELDAEVTPKERPLIELSWSTGNVVLHKESIPAYFKNGTKSAVVQCVTPPLPMLSSVREPTAHVRVAMTNASSDAVSFLTGYSDDRVYFKYARPPRIKKLILDATDQRKEQTNISLIAGKSNALSYCSNVEANKEYYIRVRRCRNAHEASLMSVPRFIEAKFSCVASETGFSFEFPRLGSVGASPIKLGTDDQILWQRGQGIYVAVLKARKLPSHLLYENSDNSPYVAHVVLESKLFNIFAKRYVTRKRNYIPEKQTVEWNEVLCLTHQIPSDLKVSIILEDAKAELNGLIDDRHGFARLKLDISKVLADTGSGTFGDENGVTFKKQWIPFEFVRNVEGLSHEAAEIEIAILQIDSGTKIHHNESKKITEGLLASRFEKYPDHYFMEQQACWIEASMNTTDFLEPELALKCYTCESPMLSEVFPLLGPKSFSVEITLSGHNFGVVGEPKIELNDCKVLFYQVGKENEVEHFCIVAVDRISETAIKCTPKFPICGTYRIAVALNGKDFDAFCLQPNSLLEYSSYDSPTISGINLLDGRYTNHLRIEGTGFIDTGAVSVKFSEINSEVEHVVKGKVLSETLIECAAPDVESMTQILLQLSLNGIHYDVEWSQVVHIQNAPYFRAVYPNVCCASGGSSVEIKGGNLYETGQIKLKLHTRCGVERVVSASADGDKLIFTLPSFLERRDNERSSIGIVEKEMRTEDAPYNYPKVFVAFRFYNTDEYADTHFLIDLYESVPVVSSFHPNSGSVWGGWTLKIKTANTIAHRNLCARFIKCAACQMETREVTVPAKVVSSSEIHVKMPKMDFPSVEIEGYNEVVLQLSNNGVEFGPIQYNQVIYFWEKWQSRVRNTNNNPGIALMNEEKRRQSVTYFRGLHLKAPDKTDVTKPDRKPSLEDLAENPSSSEDIAAATRKGLLALVPKLWPEQESNELELEAHLLQLHMERNEEFYQMLLMGFKALTPTSVGTIGPSIDRHLKTSVKHAMANRLNLPDNEYRRPGRILRQSVLQGKNRSSVVEEQLGIPIGCIDKPAFKKLITYKLYPLATSPALNGLWRKVDKGSRGYVSIEQIQNELHLHAMARQVDVPKFIDEPAETNSKGGAVMRGTERFPPTKTLPYNDRYYDFDDRVLRRKVPSWGIGQNDIRFGVKYHGRHWANVIPKTDVVAQDNLRNDSKGRNIVGLAKQSKKGKRAVRDKFVSPIEERAALKANVAPGSYSIPSIFSTREPQRPSSTFKSSAPRFKEK